MNNTGYDDLDRAADMNDVSLKAKLNDYIDSIRHLRKEFILLSKNKKYLSREFNDDVCGEAVISLESIQTTLLKAIDELEALIMLYSKQLVTIEQIERSGV